MTQIVVAKKNRKISGQKIKNMKKHNLYISLIGIALMALCSCNEANQSIYLGDSTETSNKMVKFTTVNLTRLAYDGTTTSFEDGDEIGCVICTKSDDGYEWKATTKWEYNSSLGVVTVSKLWTLDDDGNLSGEDATENNQTQIITYDSDGYTGINSTEYLYFFFYYPFTDDETTSTLMSIATSENMEAYPVFMDTGSSSEDDFSTDDLKANDLLYASITDGLSKTSYGTYGLTFAKKTATIELSSTAAIKDVKLVKGENDIVIGKTIDLTTGELSLIGEGDDNYSSSIISSADECIYAADISGDGTTYRIILPAQENFDAQLQFVYDDDDDETVQTVDLSSFSPLEAGKRYRVSIHGQKITLSFTTTANSEGLKYNESESGFFTVSGTITSYSDKDYGFTLDGTTYNDCLKFEDSQGSVTFTLAYKMQITLYFGFYVPSTTSSADKDRCCVKVTTISTDDDGDETSTYTDYAYNSNDVTIDDYAVNYTTKDGSTSSVGNYITFTLSPGKYTISKGSTNGNRVLFLVVLEYV